jgi:hypothetical protein
VRRKGIARLRCAPPSLCSLPTKWRVSIHTTEYSRAGNSFAGCDEPLPIGEIAAKAEFACALPGRACVHRVAFTAFRVAHAPISAARAVNVRSERIAMRLHFANERFHFNDGLAQAR